VLDRGYPNPLLEILSKVKNKVFKLQENFKLSTEINIVTCSYEREVKINMNFFYRKNYPILFVLSLMTGYFNGC